MTIGYTDYYGEIEKVTITNYDGDKYCDIIRANGDKESIKRGYIARNPEMTKWFAGIYRHLQEGKKKIHYKPYDRKVKYVIFVPKSEGGWTTTEFKNKIDALKYALRLAKTTNEKIEIHKDYTFQNKSGYYGTNIHTLIDCYPDGDCTQWYGDVRRKRGSFVKYLRGYGKINRQVKFDTKRK